jgi:hypothetical protein
VADPGPLARALGDLVGALDRARIDYMLVGGLAVVAHGVARLTRDVDVTIALRPDRADALVAALAPRFRPLPGDPVRFARETHVLPFEALDGTRVDANFAVLPFQEEAIGRATLRRLGPVEARFCGLEDLILHKLAADRPRDREDVRALVALDPGRLDRRRLDGDVHRLASALERPEIEAFYAGLLAG